MEEKSTTPYMEKRREMWARAEARENLREEKRKQKKKEKEEAKKLRMEARTRQQLYMQCNALEIRLGKLKYFHRNDPDTLEEIRRCEGLLAEAFAVRLKYIKETLNGRSN